jgi:K+-sensing histidine kinase KdpD
VTVIAEAAAISLSLGNEIDVRGERGALFRISDTGPGIAKERLVDIFDPMQRDDQSASLEHRGAELDLHMAKQVAEQMRGEVTVLSMLEMDSTFYVACLSPGTCREMASSRSQRRNTLQVAGRPSAAPEWANPLELLLSKSPLTD